MGGSCKSARDMAYLKEMVEKHNQPIVLFLFA